MSDELEAVTIRKVGVLSIGGMAAFIGLFAGILLMILTFIFSIVFGNYLSAEGLTIGPMIYTWILIGSVLLNFIAGLILGLFYNLSAMIVKGVKLYA